MSSFDSMESMVVGGLSVFVLVASAFPNAASGVCGLMDSRVHGNDDGWRGGGVLSFYGIVALLFFALCGCWLWQVRFQTWHLACVD
ncbi:hypothetical protein ABMX62_10755 [Vibrio vulnificus]|uniref:hypothetical protein n=1 Tax=Vibrio vulnificus TaxID=672 RepID=UPI004059EE11